MQNFLDKLAENGLSTVGIFVLVLIAIWLVQVIGKWVLRYINDHVVNLDTARQKQFTTLIQVVKWVLWVMIIASMVLALLSTLGIDITPLLASAGVAGIGLTLAAQSLLKDWIGGLFIILENQYVIGDLVKIGDVTGTVEGITLRLTLIRKFTGELCTIPNGEVRILTNMSRGWARAKVDLNVDMGEDLDRVLELVNEMAESLAADEAWKDKLIEPPLVLGPMTLDGGAFSVTVLAKTPIGQHWGVGREIRRRLHEIMLREGIEIPSSYVAVKQV